MSEQLTDPGERTRRELQAREDSRDAEKSRYETMRMLISLEYEVKANRQEIKDHIRDDNRVQSDMMGEIKSLHTRVSTVSSSVNTEKLEARYTLREMVTGALLFCGSIGALIGFIGWYFSGGKP